MLKIQIMIIQALKFQYLTPFGANIFEIELRDYRCPILNLSHILIFPAYFNNNYSLQPTSIFLSKQLFTPPQKEHNMLCSFWGGVIFFRVIKNILLFLDKRQKSIYLSFYPYGPIRFMKLIFFFSLQISSFARC